MRRRLSILNVSSKALRRQRSSGERDRALPARFAARSLVPAWARPRAKRAIGAMEDEGLPPALPDKTTRGSVSADI